MITLKELGKRGRLGNQLWQIASTIGIAGNHGQPVCFPTWDYQPYFNIPHLLFTGEDGISATEYVPHIPDPHKVFLQDFTLWERFADLVRDFLQPSEHALDILHAETAWYIDMPRKISLHVRRGDNASRAEGWRYYPLPTLDYYRRALERLPDVPVCVFSDDILWCRETLPDTFPGYEFYFYEGTPRDADNPGPCLDWKDLQLMSMANYHIISNSTYAWWGAFLAENDPHPIYPSVWYGEHFADVDWELMIPLGWRRILV